MAYIDLLSTLDDGTRIIVDIKTAKSMLSVTPGMMALDGQLRKYALGVQGINQVGFLNFVKASPEDFSKGEVSYQSWKMGAFWWWENLSSLGAAKDKTPAADWLLWAGAEETVRKMDEELAALGLKGPSKKRDEFIEQCYTSGKLESFSREQISKCRLQFVRGIIPEEDLAEIGQQIGGDMLAMRSASEAGSYPLDGGVRFPNAICGWCEMRGICLKDNKLRGRTSGPNRPQSRREGLARRTGGSGMKRLTLEIIMGFGWMLSLLEPHSATKGIFGPTSVWLFPLALGILLAIGVEKMEKD